LALLSRCTLTEAVCFHDVAKNAMRTSLDCMVPGGLSDEGPQLGQLDLRHGISIATRFL
jgi:hypothetical protein